MKVQMFNILRAVSSIAFFLIVGCAGTDFLRPSPDDFKPGQTIQSQVIQKMGEPEKTSEIVYNGKSISAITYVYASEMDRALESGVVPVRALMFYFYRDTLVGQQFTSSFKTDNSNFDDTKADSIKKGQTTYAEVIRILGNPTSIFIPPMIDSTISKAIGYLYTKSSRHFGSSSLKSSIKYLKVYFDGKEIVSKIDYSSSQDN
jgi:outer membrane protein assembly factor BamE (lipoprotein component of BamABCDE complex)